MSLLLLLGGGSGAGTLAANLSGDFALDGVKRPEFIYVGLESQNHETVSVKEESVAKWRITSATPNVGGNARLRVLVAVADGKLHIQDGTTWLVADATADPQLSATASYYWMQKYKQKLYFGDGVKYLRYCPKKSMLEEWKSEGAGAMPEKCRLSAVYQDRVVLARSDGEPSNWFMPKKGDPTNWDYVPPVQTVDQAIAGNYADAGYCPDIINALIPHHDDLLIFGCDQSIYVLRGDPMAAGQFDLISDTIGIAFGDAWCKDPSGVIYFFGSKGGVYRMAPGAAPQVISDSRDGQDVSVHKRMTSIDLSANRVIMEWDFERNGCYVLLVPNSETETTNQKGWFWDQRNNAWWEDDFGAIALQGYAIKTVDGDLEDDRRVVIGCQDGYLREINSAAVNDDGTAIDSHVLVGPMAAGGDYEVSFNRVKALFTSDGWGCDFDVFASTNADDKGQAVFTGSFGPGQNPRLPVRRKGSFMWIRLYNAHSTERWSVEELAVNLRQRGVRRIRA